MINSKYLYFNQRETFDRLQATFPSWLSPICFIADTNEIWFEGHFFQAGYESIRVSEMDNTVTVSLTEQNFKIVPGAGMSLSAQEDNTIVISCQALTKIDTEGPLEWKNGRLLHKESGVTEGVYGQTSAQEGANIIRTSKINVDKYGHVISAETVSNKIRDYVEQRRTDDINKDRQLLLAEKDVEQDDTNITRKGNALTYNNFDKTLKVPNIEIDGTKNRSVIVKKGDLIVQDGTIIGRLQGEVTGTATPKIHISDRPEYGGASTKTYGHVMLVDDMPTTPERSSDNTDKNRNDIAAKAASPYLVYNYVQASKLKINGVDANKHTVSLSGLELNFTDDFLLNGNRLSIGWTEL